MGGGDLNMKKSWHPVLLVNQERVWKAEKTKAEEDKKLKQLMKERAEERQLAELQALQEQQTGRKRQEKMDWMYATPASGGGIQGEELEDYLLGKRRVDAILKADDDKAVKEQQFQAVQQANTARDTAAKIRADPLFAIKQQEQAAYQALMSNPLRLKQLKEKELGKEGRKEEKRREKEERRREKDERRAARKSGAGGRERSRSRSPRGDGGGSSSSRDRHSHRDHRDREHHASSSHAHRERSRSPGHHYDRRRSPGPSSSSHHHHHHRERSPPPPPRAYRDDRDRGRDARDGPGPSSSSARYDGARPRSSDARDYRDAPPHHARDAPPHAPAPRYPPESNGISYRDRPSAASFNDRPPPPPPPAAAAAPAAGSSSMNADRAARLAAMMGNASSMDDDRAARLAASRASEAAELEREAAHRAQLAKTGIQADVVKGMQREAFFGAGASLEGRLRDAGKRGGARGFD